MADLKYYETCGVAVTPEIAIANLGAHLRSSADALESAAELMDMDLTEFVCLAGEPPYEHGITRVVRPADPTMAANLRAQAAAKRAIAQDFPALKPLTHYLGRQ